MSTTSAFAATAVLTITSNRNLSSNALNGSLPDQFDEVTRLATVYLDENALSGTLPPTLQNSTSLSSLHLHDNQFSGMVYFPNAKNLTQLYLARNQFTYLDLEDNAALLKVTLDDNRFNCTVPDLSRMPTLQVFSAARNALTGKIRDINTLKALTKL